MWLIASKIAAYLAAGAIGARILRLILINTLARRTDEGDAPGPFLSGVAWDRAFRWSFYLFMFAALAAFTLHVRQR